MLRNILKLNGAQKLSKNEQKNISGGLRIYKSCQDASAICPMGTECVGFDTLGRIICR